jgi:hypothetical protein
MGLYKVNFFDSRQTPINDKDKGKCVWNGIVNAWYIRRQSILQIALLSHEHRAVSASIQNPIFDSTTSVFVCTVDIGIARQIAARLLTASKGKGGCDDAAYRKSQSR